MTTFILHGGATRQDTDGNRKFFAELVRGGVAQPVKILLVFFAAEEKRWQELFEDGKRRFADASPGIKKEFTLAQPGMFAQQVRNADVIYVHGGTTRRLKEVLATIPNLNLSQLLDGKVYGGSSAGANILAKYSYSSTYADLEEGLGLLPIKVIPH